MPESTDASRLEAISTRWSLLRLARDDSAASQQEARRALVLRYLPAIHRYLRAIAGNDADADDLCQDVAVRLLSGDFGSVDPERGRFRDFLKTVLRNMALNYWKRQKRRRGVPLDPAQFTADEEDSRWLDVWRGSVLELVWKAFEQRERTQRGSVAARLLRLRMEYPDDTSAALAERLTAATGKPFTPEALRQALRRARRQFVDLLLVEVAQGLDDPAPEAIENELSALGLREYVADLLPGAVAAESVD
jgi:RNA polymerase sigma-70 factor (ECF subfamily)